MIFKTNIVYHSRTFEGFKCLLVLYIVLVLGYVYILGMPILWVIPI